MESLGQRMQKTDGTNDARGPYKSAGSLELTWREWQATGGRVERWGHDQMCSVESKVVMATSMRPRDGNGSKYGGGMKM